jgi:hypothetical protein
MINLQPPQNIFMTYELTSTPPNNLPQIITRIEYTTLNSGGNDLIFYVSQNSDSSVSDTKIRIATVRTNAEGLAPIPEKVTIYCITDDQSTPSQSTPNNLQYLHIEKSTETTTYIQRGSSQPVTNILIADLKVYGVTSLTESRSQEHVLLCSLCEKTTTCTKKAAYCYP